MSIVMNFFYGLSCMLPCCHLHIKSAGIAPQSSNWRPCEISLSISMYSQPSPPSILESNQFFPQMMLSM